MQDAYGFNPRKCNSASSMSGCIEGEMSKIILTLPTKYEHYEIFEKTVIGGFSSINTRLAFDTEILPNSTNANVEKRKDLNYKVVYNLTLNDKKGKKRIITKILKLDENNQYGMAMTKPLPTGFIKDDKDVSWWTLNFLLESISFKDKIGHFYIVDIIFDDKKATKRQLVYNNIYPLFIEKQKTIDPYERSVFQLLEQFVMGDSGPKSYRVTAKAHATLFKKKNLYRYILRT